MGIYQMYFSKIKQEKQDFSKYPHLETGKTPSENMNVKWIPNLAKLNITNKNMIEVMFVNYIESLDVTNSLIIKSYKLWELIRSDSEIARVFNTRVYFEYFKINEFIVHSIRCFVERMIGLIYYLKHPNSSNIEVDCIASYLQSKDNTYKDFDQCIDFFEVLNKLDNAYKHTVFNTGVGFVKKENSIVVKYSRRNADINNPEKITKPLTEIIASFNIFYSILFKTVESIT